MHPLLHIYLLTPKVTSPFKRNRTTLRKRNVFGFERNVLSARIRRAVGLPDADTASAVPPKDRYNSALDRSEHSVQPEFERSNGDARCPNWSKRQNKRLK